MNLKIASFLLYMISVVVIFFGILYLFTPKIMPYHEIYLGMSHEQLQPKVAALLLSAMRIIGFLSIALGLALGIIIRFPFQKGEPWSWWLILVIWLIVLLPLLFITLRIGLHTPWWLLVILLILLFVAMVITRPGRTT